jgi:hypothetical protein
MMPVRVLNGIKAKSVAGLAMPTTPWRPLGAPRGMVFVGGGAPPILADSVSTYRWRGDEMNFSTFA